MLLKSWINIVYMNNETTRICFNCSSAKNCGSVFNYGGNYEDAFNKKLKDFAINNNLPRKVVLVLHSWSCKKMADENIIPATSGIGVIVEETGVISETELIRGEVSTYYEKSTQMHISLAVPSKKAKAIHVKLWEIA